jgi:hypothetical protein
LGFSSFTSTLLLKELPTIINPKQKELADHFRSLAAILEKHTALEEVELDLLEGSIIPALAGFLNKDLYFFAIIVLGNTVSIQNWLNTSAEEQLYEASGRFHAIAQTLAECAAHSGMDECEGCDEHDPNCPLVNNSPSEKDPN